jgi:hypothetical protein
MKNRSLKPQKRLKDGYSNHQGFFYTLIVLTVLFPAARTSIDSKTHGLGILGEGDAIYIDLDSITKPLIGQRYKISNLPIDQADDMGITLTDILKTSSYFKNCNELEMV